MEKYQCPIQLWISIYTYWCVNLAQDVKKKKKKELEGGLRWYFHRECKISQIYSPIWLICSVLLHLFSRQEMNVASKARNRPRPRCPLKSREKITLGPQFISLGINFPFSEHVQMSSGRRGKGGHLEARAEKKEGKFIHIPPSRTHARATLAFNSTP